VISRIPGGLMPFVLSALFPAAFGQVPFATALIAKRVLPSLVVNDSKTNSKRERRLKDTLDELRETIPLASYKYFLEFEGSPVEVAWNAVPTRVESCSIVFDKSVTFQLPGAPTAVITTRFSVPLGVLKKISSTRRKLEDRLSGPEEVWTVSLAANSSLVVEEIRHSFDNITNIENTGLVTLDFVDESTARKSVDGFDRAAELCSSAGPEAPGIGKSLKETLDWLKQYIPLATANFVKSTDGTSVSINERSAVLSLESCTGVFDHVITVAMVDRPQNQSIGTYRFTVPLGAVAESFVVHVENLEENTTDTFISGDQWSYRVGLRSKAKNISLAKFLSPNSQSPVTEATNGFFLKFSDEAVARRVEEAFLHVSALCRTKGVD
jgi:hypothetical protein